MKKQLMEKVHFTITGEFITRHARDLWHEHKFSKVFKLLDCVTGLSREQQERIVMGTAKLVGADPVRLEPDNWQKPDPRYYCPSMEEAMARGDNWYELRQAREDAAWRYGREQWWPSRATKDTRKYFWSRLVKLAQDEELAQEIFDTVMMEHTGDGFDRATVYANRMHSRKRLGADTDVDPEEVVPTERPVLDPVTVAFHTAQQRLELAGVNTSAMGVFKEGLPTTETVFEALNRKDEGLPELCDDMSSQSGWLLPNGCYYGCPFMGHIALAEKLLASQGAEGHNAEKMAEDLGWIKIARGPLGLYVGWHGRHGKPTKRQQTKLWDYAQFHKLDYKAMLDDNSSLWCLREED